MADIVHGEKLKKVFRMMLKLGYKTLEKDMIMVGEDLKYNQNPVIKNLNNLIILTANNLHQKDGWQKQMVLSYGQSLLWMVGKDTGYRDQFFWALDKLLEHPEEFRKLLKPYVKPPEEWIANLWEKSKEKSNELKKRKMIPANAKSFEESVFTPRIQEKRHQKLLRGG